MMHRFANRSISTARSATGISTRGSYRRAGTGARAIVLAALLALGLAAAAACSAGRAAEPGGTVPSHSSYGPAYGAPAAPGYGTAGAPAPAAAAPGADSMPAGEAASADYDYESSTSRQPSSAAVSTGQGQPVEQQRERPGLGTVFGETMDSRVNMRPFQRATTSPFAAVAMFYNDQEGVLAHAGYRGSEHLAPLSAYTPHGGISITLTDAYGNPLPGGAANGRVLIVGSEGQRYNIVMHNRTGGRYEVVASVDGLDVIDGRPADLGKRGYILEPYGTLTIDGFRRSEHAVAAFRFGRVSESYAARTSGDRNVGVIGLAFFAERGSQWTSDELYRRDTANPFPGDRSYAQPPRY